MNLNNKKVILFKVSITSPMRKSIDKVKHWNIKKGKMLCLFDSPVILYSNSIMMMIILYMFCYVGINFSWFGTRLWHDIWGTVIL